MKLSVIKWAILLGAFINACSVKEPQITPSADNVNLNTVSTAAISYPPTSVTPSPNPNIRPFQINRPVLEGAVELTGTGPAGVPIILKDRTFMGEYMGETVIGPDGVFKISVPPLEGAHRIGIILGDLTGTLWRMEDFISSAYHGPEAMQTPNVGFFYDTVMVQKP